MLKLFIHKALLLWMARKMHKLKSPLTGQTTIQNRTNTRKNNKNKVKLWYRVGGSACKKKT